MQLCLAFFVVYLVSDDFVRDVALSLLRGPALLNGRLLGGDIARLD